MILFSFKFLVMLLNLSSIQAVNVTAWFKAALPAGVYTSSGHKLYLNMTCFECKICYL